MKITERVLSFFLTAVMLLSVLPLTVSAASGSGTTLSDPRVVSSFAEFKEAMEDTSIEYVELASTVETLPEALKYTYAIDVNSFNTSETASQAVTLTLYCPDNTQRTLTVLGNSASYSFENVPGGVYSLAVSKQNHVTRYVEVVVSSNIGHLITINPLGDTNGDGQVTTVDFGRANSHARGKSTLIGYEFDCADVNADSQVTTADAGRINSHARGKTKLW